MVECIAWACRHWNTSSQATQHHQNHWGCCRGCCFETGKGDWEIIVEFFVSVKRFCVFYVSFKSLQDKKSAAIREGALLCLEGLTINLGGLECTQILDKIIVLVVPVELLQADFLSLMWFPPCRCCFRCQDVSSIYMFDIIWCSSLVFAFPRVQYKGLMDG